MRANRVHVVPSAILFLIVFSGLCLDLNRSTAVAPTCATLVQKSAMQMQQNSSRSPHKPSHFSFSLPPAPPKRPRSPPLPLFQPCQDDSDSDSDQRSDPPDRQVHSLKGQLPAKSHAPSFTSDSTLTPVQQRYYRLRHSRRVQRRRPRPTLPPPPLSSAKARSGSAIQSAQQKPTQPQTIWDQLAGAAAKIRNAARKDPRFSAAQRPLDLLTHLRASIAVTLFPDGYVRHDWTCQDWAGSDIPERPTPSPRVDTIPKGRSSIATSQRIPYDRNSRDFLKCLDLGILPPAEDIPLQKDCHYYDGCLIAEITDLRAPMLSFETSERVLLRGDSATFYQDVDDLTATLHPDIACKVEQRILSLTTPWVDTRPFSFVSTRRPNMRSTVHSFNIARIQKRKRIVSELCPAAKVRKRDRDLVSSAWLLIALANRQQAMCHNAALTLRLGNGDGTLAGSSRADGAVASGAANVGTPLIRGDTKSGLVKGSPKLRNTSAVNASKAFSRKLRMPPDVLLSQHVKTREVESAASRVGSSSNQHQKHFTNDVHNPRSLKLIQPERNMSQMLQATQLAMMHGTEGAAERAAYVRNQMVSDPEQKAGRPVYLVDMLLHPDGSADVKFVRTNHGEKQCDVFRVPMGSEEAAQKFMDQFRKLSESEGYCLQDSLSNDPSTSNQTHEKRDQSHGPQQQQQQPTQLQQQQQPQQQAHLRQRFPPQHTPQQFAQQAALAPPQQAQSHQSLQQDLLPHQQLPNRRGHSHPRPEQASATNIPRVSSQVPPPFNAHVHSDHQSPHVNSHGVPFSQSMSIGQPVSQPPQQTFSMSSPQPLPQSIPLPLMTSPAPPAPLPHSVPLHTQRIAQHGQAVLPSYGVHQNSLHQMQQQQLAQMRGHQQALPQVRNHVQGRNADMKINATGLGPVSGNGSPSKAPARNGVHLSQGLSMSRSTHSQTPAHLQAAPLSQQKDKTGPNLGRNAPLEHQQRQGLNMIGSIQPQDISRRVQGAANLNVTTGQGGSIHQSQQEMLRQQAAKQQQIEQLRLHHHQNMAQQHQQQLQQQMQRHEKGLGSTVNSAPNANMMINGNAHARGLGANGIGSTLGSNDFGLGRVGIGSAALDASAMSSMGLIGSLGPLNGLNPMGPMVGFGGHGNGAISGNVLSNALNHNALIAQHLQQAQSQSQQLQSQQLQQSPQQLQQAQQHQHAFRNAMPQLRMAERQRALAASGIAAGGTGGVGGVGGIGAYPPQAALTVQQRQALAAVLGSAAGASGVRGLPGAASGGVSDSAADILNHAHLSAQFNAQRENVDASSRAGRQR